MVTEVSQYGLDSSLIVKPTRSSAGKSCSGLSPGAKAAGTCRSPSLLTNWSSSHFPCFSHTIS